MPEPDRIIRLKTVLHRTGLSRSTAYRKIARPCCQYHVDLLIGKMTAPSRSMSR